MKFEARNDDCIISIKKNDYKVLFSSPSAGVKLSSPVKILPYGILRARNKVEHVIISWLVADER